MSSKQWKMFYAKRSVLEFENTTSESDSPRPEDTPSEKSE